MHGLEDTDTLLDTWMRLVYLLLACHLNNRFRVYKRTAFANERDGSEEDLV